MGQAQLITPEGKTFVLPEHIYFRVMELLEVERPPRKWTPGEIEEVIKETRGSLRAEGKRPLTEALLEFRREERELERKREKAHPQTILFEAKTRYKSTFSIVSPSLPTFKMNQARKPSAI